MSYIALGASAAAQADKAVADAQKWNEQYEQHAGSVDPEVKAYLVMRDSVFALADQLGIGQQVRVLYHTTAVGAKGGVIGGTASGIAVAVAEQVEAGAGSAVAAQYSSAIGTGAAIGMTAGAVVGVVVALFSLFSEDDTHAAITQERAERKAARAAARTRMLARLDMNGLVQEARDNAAAARKQAKYVLVTPAGAAAQNAAASAADKMVQLYEQIAQRFKPDDLQLFVSNANLQRWASALATNSNSQKGLLAGSVVLNESLQFTKNLQAKIAAEQKTLNALLAARRKKAPQASQVRSAKLAAASTASMSSAAGVFTGLVVVGSGLFIFHMSRKKRGRR